MEQSLEEKLAAAKTAQERLDIRTNDMIRRAKETGVKKSKLLGLASERYMPPRPPLTLEEQMRAKENAARFRREIRWREHDKRTAAEAAKVAEAYLP